MSETFLTKEEVSELTGRKNKKKQVEQLRKMGLPFWVNAVGAPIVARSTIESKRQAAPTEKSRSMPAVLPVKVACGADDRSRDNRAVAMPAPAEQQAGGG